MTDAQLTPKPPKRRWIAIMLAAFIILVVFAAIIAASVLFGMNTQWGRSQIAAMISKNDTIDVGAIKGNLFSTFTVNDVALSDPDGIWLQMPEARLTWSVWPLLQRKVVIEDIIVPTVDVIRAPNTPADPDAEPFKLTDLTAQPVSIALQNLNIEQVSWLGSDERAENVTIAARATLTRNTEIEVLLALVPLTPGTTDEINADILLNTIEQSASTKITLKTDADGMLSSLIGLPGATNAIIDGKGTLDDWSGFTKADVAGTSVADITASYKAPSGSAKGSVFIAPFIETDGPNGLAILNTPFDLDATFSKTSAAAFDLKATIANTAIQTDLDGALKFFTKTPSVTDFKWNTAITGRVGGIQLDGVKTATVIDGGFDQLTATTSVKATAIQTSAATLQGPAVRIDMEGSAATFIADVSGTIDAVSGVSGIDPQLLRAIQVTGSAQRRENALTASAAIDNTFFDIRIEDVAQDSTGAFGGTVEAIIADLTRFPGAIEAAAKINAKIAQKPSGDTAIKLTSTLSPQKGTTHWIGRLAEKTLKISANSQISQSKISVSQVTISSSRTAIRGSAAIEGGRIDAAISGQIQEAAFSDLVPGGTGAPATFDISANGPIDTVLPAGTLRLPGITAAGLTFRDLALDLAPALAQQKSATTVSLTGRSNAGPVNANALVERLTGGGIRIDTLDARLANVTATGNVLAAGGTAKPKGALTLAIVPVSYAQSGLFGLSGNIEVTAALNEGDNDLLAFSGKGRRLTYGPADEPIAQMRAIALDGTVDLSGDVPSLVAQASAKSLEAGGLFFDRFSLTSALNAGVQNTSITLEQSGVRPTNAVLDIVVDPAQETTRISIQPSGTLAAYPFTSDAPIRLTLSGGTMTLEPSKLTIGGGTVSLSAQQSPANLIAETQIEDFQLRTLTDLLQRPAYYGALTAKAALISQPNAGSLDSTFSINGLSAQSNSKLAINMSGSARTSGDQLLTQVTAGHNGEEDELTADVKLPISWPETPSAPAIDVNAPIAGTTTLNSRLAPWWQLIDMPDQVLTGVLTGAIELNGSLTEIKPTGRIALTETRYENLEFGTQLEALEAEVELKEGRLSLTSLSATDGRGGTLNASAEVDLFPFIPQRSHIVLKDFQLLAKEDLGVRADADLGLDYKNERLALSGDITIAQARYAVSTSGAASVPTLPIEEINKSALDGESPGSIVVDTEIETPVTQGGIPPIDLDIKVTAARRIFVTGMGLTSEWRTALDIQGTAQTPTIEGEIELVRGELEFAGKRFALDRGKIYLDGGKEIDPRLDILAENTQADFTARIGITGTPSSPDIALSSTPSLPDDEILSRILFGTSATDLSALEAVQLGSALAALSSGGGSSALDIAGKARSATGLDRLSLGNNDSSTAITGGKYLSPDVYLQFTTDPSSGQYLAAIEWYVTRTLSLLSEYGAETGSNVAARWSRTY